MNIKILFMEELQNPDSSESLANMKKGALEAIQSGHAYAYALETTVFLANMGFMPEQRESVLIAFADMLSKDPERIKKQKNFGKTYKISIRIEFLLYAHFKTC